MIKKRFFYLLFVLSYVFVQAAAYSDFFPENQALNAERNYGELLIPLVNSKAVVANSLLRIGDLKIFQNDHYITEAEKKILTKDDLFCRFSAQTTFFQMGLRNYDISWNSYLFGKSKILEKEYTKFVLYGNEEDEYTFHSGEDTQVFGFSEIKFNYAHKKPFTLKRTSIFFGANFNIYYPLYYFGVPESFQQFGTTYDATYYEYKLHYLKTEKLNGTSPATGIGFGFKAKLNAGWFYFSVDDLFAKLKYSNLRKYIYEKEYVDSLFYFDNDYEAFEEETVSDSIFSDKKLSLSPSVALGFEYTIKNQTLMIKYKHSDYSFPNGISIGYRNYSNTPLDVILGIDDNFYFQFKMIFITPCIDYLFGFTYFDSIFNYSRGLGLELGIRLKFDWKNDTERQF
ncbi:MAG: hypothetical protein DRZ79_06605 [Candidatus Cloacimonadota bacterium]|nr:MAG: hypothetical protein DRZ79_06605 [Candidatus Cloacimonadota bacterium]